MSAPEALGGPAELIEAPARSAPPDAGPRKRLSPARLSALWRGLVRRRAPVLAYRGDRARDAGDFAAAAALYRRALAGDPSRADIRVQLAHMLKELALYGEAEAAYRQAAAQRPADGDMHLQLGHLLKLLGRTEDAIAAYEMAHPLLGGSDAAAVELRALGAVPPGEEAERAELAAAAESHVAEANRLRDEGRFEAAAEAYGRALRLAPSRIAIRIQQGNMLKDCGRLAEAETAYRGALARMPETPEAHLQLGHLLKLQGRREEAVAAYRRAVQLQPSLEPAWAELSHLGCPEGLERRFEDRLARGGVDVLLEIAGEVRRLQDAVVRLAAALPEIAAETAFPVGAYDRFRSLYDVPPPTAGSELRFAVVLTAAGVPLSLLYEQLASLTAQAYPHWRLAVIGDDAAQRRAVERAAASDARIAWHDSAPGESPEDAERRVASNLCCDWLVLPAKGARLHRHALGWAAAAAADVPALAFAVDQEDRVGGEDRVARLVPQFRQAVDYDTLLEANPFGQTLFVAQAAYAGVAAGLTGGSLATARSALLLALAARRAVGHLPLPLAIIEADPDEQPEAARAAAQQAHAAAVRAYVAAAGLGDRIRVEAAERADAPLAVSWQPRHADEPLDVIIPTRDNAADLAEFVASLRRRAAAPGSVRVLIVDNGSSDGETARVLAGLAVDEGAQIVRIEEPFNWSRLNNRGAALCRSRLLVFANDDMLMLSDGWDRQLRGQLERPDVGAVGARLLYPDDTVQHAGIVFGWPSITIHDGRHEPATEPGPCGRWHLTRAVAAVTGAFLAVRREDFAAVGGFDETGLPVAYGDIDFALKLRARGLAVLWTPAITLRHYESKSRGLDHLDPEKRARNEAERRVIERRWGAALQADPGVNPAWHAATLPFRLISAPSEQRLWRHIRLCAAANPWLPDCGGAQAPSAAGVVPHPGGAFTLPVEAGKTAGAMGPSPG